MYSTVRAGKAGFTALAALSLLSLSGIALSAMQERPDPTKVDPKAQDATKITQQPAPATQTPEAVTKALTDLRQSIRTELEKSAFLQGKGVDMNSLVITAGNAGNAIAGAPASGGTLPGGGLGKDAPPDPNRPDPAKPGGAAGGGAPASQALGEEQIVGVVMLVGSFRPRVDSARAQPAESSFRGDVGGGTFTVRRASATSPMVQLVDSNDRTVATIPILGFHEQGAGGAGGGAGAAGERPAGAGAGAPSTVAGGEMRANPKQDWGRVYLSILYYFQPDMG